MRGGGMNKIVTLEDVKKLFESNKNNFGFNKLFTASQWFASLPESDHIIVSKAEILKYVRDALENAHECNESNGYHNSWDMDLIIASTEEAIDRAMKG